MTDSIEIVRLSYSFDPQKPQEWRNDKIKLSRHEVTAVLKRTGGKMLDGAKQFGEKNHKTPFDAIFTVAATKGAVKEIESLPYIFLNRMSEEDYQKDAEKYGRKPKNFKL